MANHFCVRVYANGEARYTIRDAKAMTSWLEYNRRSRGGNALFVDGRLPDTEQDRGYLKADQIAAVSKRLEAAMGDMAHQPAWQPAYDPLEKATIYPEKNWPRFEWEPAPTPEAPCP